MVKRKQLSKWKRNEISRPHFIHRDPVFPRAIVHCSRGQRLRRSVTGELEEAMSALGDVTFESAWRQRCIPLIPLRPSSSEHTYSMRFTHMICPYICSSIYSHRGAVRRLGHAIDSEIGLSITIDKLRVFITE